MAVEVVTMDQLVSLARRRGFVFPSSEIYGGLGSTYDYGHYGVLLKNNIKARWFEAMILERDDIVALDCIRASGRRRATSRASATH
jgi:glycyl-tRNA synthetase